MFLLTEHNFRYIYFFRTFIYLMNDERHKPPKHKLTHTHAHIRYQLFRLDSVIL